MSEIGFSSTDSLVAGDKDPNHSYHGMGDAGAHAGGELGWLQVTSEGES